MSIKERLMNLNGWRRLWLVGAVASLLYALIWGADIGEIFLTDYLVVTKGFSNPECSAVVTMPAGTKLNPRPPTDSPCWSLHHYRSTYKDAANTADGYERHVSSLRSQQQLAKTGVGLVMWIIGVALIYFLGWVVAWVIKGFRK